MAAVGAVALAIILTAHVKESAPCLGLTENTTEINQDIIMKKLILIITAVMAINCTSVFAATPVNKYNNMPVVHQNNKNPHSNKMQPKSHHNKQAHKKPYIKMPEKRAPEARPAHHN